jgi:hypothetical protein
MNRPIKSIAAEWEAFKARVLDITGADKKAIAEFRAMFFSGAKACFFVIREAEDRDATIEAVRDELNRYGEQVRERGIIE